MPIDAHPQPVDALRIEVPATADRLVEIRHLMQAWLTGVGVSGVSAADIVLVVNEACTNCVEHAYRDGEPGLMRVGADLDGTRIDVDVADFGVWQPPTGEITTRGRGLPIMGAVADRMELEHSPTGTTVRFSFAARRD